MKKYERYEKLWNKYNAQMGMGLASFQKLVIEIKSPLYKKIKKLEADKQ